MEAAFRYILKQFLDPYITGLDGKIDCSVSAVNILDLKVREELLKRLREAPQLTASPLELQEARIGRVTLRAVEFGKLQVVASEVVFDLDLVPLKALNRVRDAGREEREAAAPGFVHLVREAPGDGYWNALVGATPSPPEEIRANYCLQHLSNRKRRRAGVREFDCKICAEKVRTNFDTLAICVRCSLRSGRCLHCNSSEVPVKMPYHEDPILQAAEVASATSASMVLPLGEVSLLDNGFGEAATVGHIVTVLEDFESNSREALPLCAGLKGEITVVDEDGDAQIAFEGIAVQQWVCQENFAKIGLAQGLLGGQSSRGSDYEELPFEPPPSSSHAQDRPAVPPQSRQATLLGSGGFAPAMPSLGSPCKRRGRSSSGEPRARSTSPSPSPPAVPPRERSITPNGAPPSATSRWETASFELPMPMPRCRSTSDASTNSDDSEKFSPAHREILKARRRQEELDKRAVPDTEDPCRPSLSLSVNPETLPSHEVPPVRRRVRKTRRSNSREEEEHSSRRQTTAEDAGEVRRPAQREAASTGRRPKEKPPKEKPPKAHALGEPIEVSL